MSEIPARPDPPVQSKSEPTTIEHDAPPADVSMENPPLEPEYEAPQIIVDNALDDVETSSSSDDDEPIPSSRPSSAASHRSSFSSISSTSFSDELENLIPLDKLTIFDFLQNLDLPQKLEKWQSKLQSQTQRVKRQQQRLTSRGVSAKDRVLQELKKRTPEERLDRYRQRMRDSVDRLGERWNDASTVTMREKISFLCGVLNVFISGWMIGAHPTWMYKWYTAQLLVLMPARYVSYHKIGYHYFLADMCYFVNLLAMLSIWVAPQSKRLFISTFCLAFGNNAIAIALWRNSLVFHSVDKVTSIAIHILAPVSLHCLTHMTPKETLQERFPAIYHIKYSPRDSPEHYGLASMMIWATVPYAIWQLAYYLLINVRRADKIAAGRPTSFTWLKKSYAKTWIGHVVLSLPAWAQEGAFMFIQYSYAILTIIPCPLWFWYHYASSAFLCVVFTWAVYNGATYYIDVFGNRFKREVEELKREVAKWQQESPHGDGPSAPASPNMAPMDKKADATAIDKLPPLDQKAKSDPVTPAAGTSGGEKSLKENKGTTTGSESQQGEGEVRHRE